MSYPRWIVQPESGAFEELPNGAATYTVVAESERGQGLVEATAQGFPRRAQVVVQGRLLILASRRADPIANAPTRERVTLRFQSQLWRGTTYSKTYRDGSTTKKAGDERWFLEGSTGDVPASEAVSYDGNVLGTIGGDATVRVKQASLVLVWQKWLDVNSGLDGAAEQETLPRSLAAALEMAETYRPDGSGSYESNPPRLQHRLADGDGAKYLCVDVRLEEDGDLLLRTARFLHNPYGWASGWYGAP